MRLIYTTEISVVYNIEEYWTYDYIGIGEVHNYRGTDGNLIQFLKLNPDETAKGKEIKFPIADSLKDYILKHVIKKNFIDENCNHIEVHQLTNFDLEEGGDNHDSI